MRNSIFSDALKQKRKYSGLIKLAHCSFVFIVSTQIAKLKNDSAVLNTEAEAAITKAKETIDDQS